uniref:Mitochondrial import receptor subunit TOM7 homolog n=1 Tax=Capra hircus TaxID=9925 RepID=A0A8C2S411_CAPHI
MRFHRRGRGGARQVKEDELRPSFGDAHDSCRKGRCGACASPFVQIRDAVCCCCLTGVGSAVTMVKLSKEAKQRLQQLFKGGQFAIRWGFIPLVIYLGFKRGADPGMPEPTVLRKNLTTLDC